METEAQVREWVARLAALPGVQAVGTTSHLPLDHCPNWRAMGTRLAERRYFDDRDRAGSPRVAIVDEMLHLSFVMRTQADPLGLASVIRDLLHQRDADLALSEGGPDCVRRARPAPGGRAALGATRRPGTNGSQDAGRHGRRAGGGFGDRRCGMLAACTQSRHGEPHGCDSHGVIGFHHMDAQRAAYDEVCAYTMSRPGFILQHVVDAFAVQTANEDSKPIGVVFGLVGLYLHVERRFSGRQVQQAHMELGRRKRQWPRMDLPGDRGAMTVTDVLAAPAGPARDRAIDEWCRCVWAAFGCNRQAVIDLLREYRIS